MEATIHGELAPVVLPPLMPPTTGCCGVPGGNTMRLKSTRLPTLAGARAFSTCRRT